MGQLLLFIVLILSAFYMITLIKKQYKNTNLRLMKKYIAVMIFMTISCIITFLLDAVMEFLN